MHQKEVQVTEEHVAEGPSERVVVELENWKGQQKLPTQTFPNA